MTSEEKKINIKDLRVEIIEERHSEIIKNFNVDEKNPEEVELKDFLIEDALKNQLMGISTTYLWFYNPNNTLIGYITVLTDAVRIHGTRDLQTFL